MEHPEEQKYSEDEVQRIIRRALRREPREAINHAELLETGRELGIDPEAIEAAIAEEQAESQSETQRRERERRRKAEFYAHFWSFVIVIGALAVINLFTGGAWWFQWPALAWGIGLAFHFKETYFPSPKVERDRPGRPGRPRVP